MYTYTTREIRQSREPGPYAHNLFAQAFQSMNSGLLEVRFSVAVELSRSFWQKFLVVLLLMKFKCEATTFTNANWSKRVHLKSCICNHWSDVANYIYSNKKTKTRKFNVSYIRRISYGGRLFKSCLPVPQGAFNLCFKFSNICLLKIVPRGKQSFF